MSRSLTIGAMAVMSLLLAVPALAGGRNSSSITLVMVSGASVSADTSSGPSYGSQVTFAVSTTATDRPYVTLNCYQNGQWLLSGQAGFYAAYPSGQNFTLASSSWTGGAGTCTATLGELNADGTKFRALASTTFDVSA